MPMFSLPAASAHPKWHLTALLYVLVVTALLLVHSPVRADWLGNLVKPRAASTEPLPPEQAFPVKAKRLDRQTVRVEIGVAPAYYVYKDRLQLALKDTPGVRISRVDYPQPEIKQDPEFGSVPVYTQPFSVLLTLEGKPAGPIKLLARSQGCFETRGLCYPPQTQVLTLP
ncbi:protein-disulfide reductase DsbD N-terminal domain-containing protein [Chitinimonas sp. BJYL2]|uniref:protein-disulfide reductase DsbD N-terminal domain-containing protein n=1 Tax=Chitinimonas sp. BJYL2 TaxID=2976696 RepID=UPI0022B53E7B|nr:protein-disulfide reductase DsbD N-terminal domain-containing protein [Chitinimonas sp. BJYL2]